MPRQRIATAAQPNDTGSVLPMGRCNICFIVALERIDAATCLLLQSLAPFSAAFLGWLVHRWAATVLQSSDRLSTNQSHRAS